MWDRIDNLWNKVKKELENPSLPLNSSTSLGNNNNSQLFQSIIDIDFSKQEDTVREAIKCQKSHKRTGAFLIHGYDENCGHYLFFSLSTSIRGGSEQTCGKFHNLCFFNETFP